jgi:hypothetical protein
MIELDSNTKEECHLITVGAMRRDHKVQYTTYMTKRLPVLELLELQSSLKASTSEQYVNFFLVYSEKIDAHLYDTYATKLSLKTSHI